MDLSPGTRAAKIERGRRLLHRFRAKGKRQQIEPKLQAAAALQDAAAPLEQVQAPRSAAHECAAQLCGHGTGGAPRQAQPQQQPKMPTPPLQPLLSPQRLREQLRMFESSSPLLKGYTPETIQTAACSPPTTGVAVAGAAFGFNEEHSPPQPPQAMQDQSVAATKQQIVPAPATPKRSLFSDTPQPIAVSSQTIAAAHAAVAAAAHTPLHTPIHSTTASPEKTPLGKPSRIEKQAEAVLKHSQDVRRLAAGVHEEQGLLCTPGSSHLKHFGAAGTGSPVQSNFGNEHEMLKTAKTKVVQLAAEISRAVDAYSLCSESVALSNTVLSGSPGFASNAGGGMEGEGAEGGREKGERWVSPAQLDEKERDNVSPLMLRDKLTALSSELHFLKSPAMMQIREFLSEGGREKENTCRDEEAHDALEQNEKSAVSLTVSDRNAAIRSWLNAKRNEEMFAEILDDHISVNELARAQEKTFGQATAELEAIERKQLVLYEQVGGVVGLLLEREAETARLRAELATSRSLLQDIESQRDQASENLEEQVRVHRAALIEEHQQELRDVEERAIKEVEHAVQELERERVRIMERESDIENDRAQEIERMKTRQGQEEATAMAKQEQRENQLEMLQKEEKQRMLERERVHEEHLHERDQSLAKLNDHCAGLEKERNEAVEELRQLHGHIASWKDRENELLDSLKTRDETIQMLEHQKVEQANSHAKELAGKDALICEKEEGLQSHQEQIYQMEREVRVRDEEIELKNALLAEKDARLAEKDETILEKEEALREQSKRDREAGSHATDRLQQALDKQVKDSDQLKEQLKLNAAEMSKLEHQAQKDATRRGKELATLKEQLALYETEIMGLEKRLKEAVDANAQYKQELEVHVSSLSRAKEEIATRNREWEEVISERDRQIEDRCMLTKEMERQISVLSAEMATNQHTLDQKIANQDEQIAELQKEKLQHSTLVDTLETAMQEKDIEISNLNQNIASRDADIVRLNALLETNSIEIAERERERDAALADRDSAAVTEHQALIQVETELKEKAAKLEEMEAEASSRQDELFEARAEVSELVMEISKATDALEQQKADVKERMRAKEMQLADLQTEIQTRMAEVEELQTKLSMVRCEFGMTQEELEKTRSQLSTITAALDSTNQERDSAAEALESMKQERDAAVKEKEREAIMRAEETTVLKENVAKNFQEREAALMQVNEFVQKFAARDKEKEKEKLLRLENKRLATELKATAEKLSLQESNTKQLTATLKTKNGEIIKLSKALRAVENDLASGAAPATGTGTAKTPTKKRGKPSAIDHKQGPGDKNGGDEEILRDQIEELMNSQAGLEETLQAELERVQQMEEELLTRQHELHACRKEMDVCREKAGLAQQLQNDLKAANDTLKEHIKQLETERTAVQQEHGILQRRASALELKALDLSERLATSEKLCTTLEHHLSEARAAASRENGHAGCSEQLWKSVTELEKQVLVQRREGQRLRGQLSESECQVRALVEERDQVKEACMRSQQACNAIQATAEQAQNELTGTRTLAETMKSTNLLLEGREHGLAHSLGVVCNDVAHSINGLEQCMQKIQVVASKAGDRARAASCIEHTAKKRVAEMGHENVELRRLLQGKVDEIVQLQRAKDKLLRSQVAAAAEAERERARMHKAIVTVQTSHTSLLECNETLRDTCKRLRAELHNLQSKQGGDAQSSSPKAVHSSALATVETIPDFATFEENRGAAPFAALQNEGSANGAKRIELALLSNLGGGCDTKRNAQALHSEIAILRKEKRMLHHQLADLQMQYDEVTAQVHSAKLEVESIESEAAAAHSDLEVCALEINRLQELYAKEKEEKEGLARELQTRGLSDKLDKELERSSKFVDEWDVDGGPFLRTRSEADSHSKDEWDNAKASLMLQNAWLRDALRLQRTREKEENYRPSDNVGQCQALLPVPQPTTRSSSASSDAPLCEWAAGEPLANDSAASSLRINAGSTIVDRSGSEASGPLALYNEVLNRVAGGPAGVGQSMRDKGKVGKSYAETFERRRRLVGERRGMEESVNGKSRGGSTSHNR